MMISAKLVKELRDKTGAGMLDCKKALEATNGNVDEAIDYLREKGIAKAAKKADRIAAEGLCNIVVEGNEALLFELNSETDFVAQNKQFLDLLDQVGNTLLSAKVDNTEDALLVDNNGETIEKTLQAATAKIGEKFTLRRVTRVVKTDDQTFGYYKHMGGRIVSLAVLNGGSDDVAKDIAMHVAAQQPKYLDRNAVDPEVLEHEKKVLTQQALEEGKPESIVEKMVIGRVNKFLKDICLVDQPFVKDPDQTVSNYVKANQASVASFIRLEVGEGIEKKEEDFAQEVMNQARQTQ